MPNFDLLGAVQPSEGWYAIVGIKEGEATEQYLLETREEVDEQVQDLLTRQKNVFFGVAKFATDEGRKQDNVLAVKALWLDIDCGANKAEANPKTGRPDGYATQAEALTELRAFVRLLGMPKPIVVNSGRGLHVYWPFTDSVTRHEWEPVARRLKQLCVTHNFYADPACFDISRVLRIPDTYNYKGDTPALVTVLVESNAMDFEDIRDILGVKESPLEAPVVRPPMSEMGRALQSSLTANFSKIMQRGTMGCAQLNACYEERASLAEPRWFSALSIAKFCTDKDTAVHKLSAEYEGYDPEKTAAKMSHILGPHTCAVFEAQNPGGCDKCPHKGKIKSPIALGRELIIATPDEEVEVEVPVANGSVVTNKYVIPEYPYPFARGKNGGVWLQPTGDDEAEPTLVYRNDFYAFKRLEDPEHGYTTVMRLHLPKDGVREFAVPNSKIMDGAELRKFLASKGVTTTNPKKMNLMIQYLLLSIEHFEDNHKADIMRNQFGWADNDSKFIVGYKEFSASGIYHHQPASGVEFIADVMGPQGSFDKWKEVINLFGREGMEPHAFAVATALGAPLFKLSGQKGAILNMIHPDSGTGKTTILHACNSFWGSPDKLCATQDDTFNSKVHKIGVHNSLPICFDEMTNTPGKQLSELAYLITQGKGKDRMKGSSNELRRNLTSWTTVALCSSNKSFYEGLEDYKGRPDGETMRILEYTISEVEAIDKEYAKDMFDRQLLANYGFAGEIYAKYLVDNWEEVKETYYVTQKLIDRTLKLQQKERFWSALLAGNLTGIHIAIRLGLLDWDLKRITQWVFKMMQRLRKQVAPPKDTDLSVLGEFINNNMGHMLIVNEGVDRRSSMQALPQLEPRNELRIRFEPDTKQVYIVARAFRKHCSELSINHRSIIDQLTSRGLLLKTANKRMTKGMRLSSPAVPALWLNGAHPDISELAESLAHEGTPQDAADAGSGS
jgi:hypothetical protein